MKIVVISDTHSLHSGVKIPECDYLLHAGDITGNGSVSHVLDIAEWFTDLKEEKIVKENIITIAGNHDECLEVNPYKIFAKDYLRDFVYLENESFTLKNGMKIYGSPYTPRFLNWFFMLDRGEEMKKNWDLIPADTDILLTHGPAYGILDEVDIKYRRKGEDPNVGCKDLKNKLETMTQIKYVIHGHIHNGYGVSVPGKKKNEITYINCSICNEDYNPVNDPILIEV